MDSLTRPGSHPYCTATAPPTASGTPAVAAASLAARRLGWALCAAGGLLTLPSLVVEPAAGIDPSWELGLHLARDHGFVVGRDIVFNYGPWGFLNIPLTLTRSLWLAAVAYRVAVQLALFIALGLWMQRRLAGWLALAPALPLVLFSPTPEYRLLLALVLWTRLALDARKERPLPLAALGAAAAAAVLIKFSMGLAALLVVLGGAVAGWTVGRKRSALAFGAGFAGGLVGCGVLALESLAALGRFLQASLEISVGYGAALERRGPLWQPILVLAAAGLAALGTVRERQCGARESLPFALPLAGLLAITFKHAFVRHETHAFLAFEVGSIALTWLVLDAWGRGARPGQALRAAGAVALVAGALVVRPPAQVWQLPAALGRTIGEALEAEQRTRDPRHRTRLRAELQRALPLHARARAQIGDRTVDILTVEVAMAEAWSLNWSPRPVLQSYAVATPLLDDLDAAFFAGPGAPQRLLVSLQGLDTRHPFVDAPRTWRQILSRYQPLGRDARWLVLGLRDHPLEVVERRLGRARVPLNQVAGAPRPRAGHLELRARLAPSLLGRLVAWPWKLPEVRLGLAAADPTPPRRILAATADRPFPLTRAWVDTPEDAWNLFADPTWPAPPGVAFVTRGAWAWQAAEVDFYEVSYREPQGVYAAASVR